MSRLDILDAAFHYASKSASRDQYVLLTFDSAGNPSPAFEDITDFIDVRARRIPDLNKVLVEIPGNLDYPHWSYSRTSKPPVIEFDCCTWQDVVEELGELVRKPVDATRSTWQVHIAREVEGVPHASGRAVVVVFQVSHALTDGRGASRLARALFAPRLPDEVGVRPPPAFRPGLGVPLAVGASIALPFRLAAARLAAWRARRAFARGSGSAVSTGNVPRPPIRGNTEPTGNRVVHVIPCAPHQFEKLQFTVTTTALTAVGLATERYLTGVGDATPDTLNALVPMALPSDLPWPAANRVLNAAVDLHVTVSDITDRARRIATSMAKARTYLFDPLLLRWVRAENRVPAPIYLALSKRAERRSRSGGQVPNSVTSNVTVVSVDRGAADLELCGAPCLFSGGFPMLGPARSVSHGFYGIGGTITVCVTACPDTFPDHERYARILAQAVSDVTAATTD